MNFSRKLFIGLLMIVCFSVTAYCQDKSLKAYVIGFYNLENLFDTINDPNKNDEQFLPDGDYSWGTLKYTNKLKKMSYAISQMPKNLAVLGVSEVENIDVLQDLVKEESIINRNLKPILVEGPDKRGVDVGLLYNPTFYPDKRNIHSHHQRNTQLLYQRPTLRFRLVRQRRNTYHSTTLAIKRRRFKTF